MRFTLRQLQVFQATADLGTLSAAAESLAISQSAASNALAELEGRYRTRLFDRQGKKLKINSLGIIFKSKCEAILRHAEELEATLLGNEAHARLAVGASLTIGNYLAIDILAAHRARHPNVETELHVANTERISQAVLDFDIDVGLIEGDILHAELALEHWMQDELQICCAPDHPLARVGQQGLTDAQLQRYPWILRESGSGTRQTFDRAMQGLLPSLNISMELEHTEAIKRAVESGLGISCLSKVCLAPAAKRGDIVCLRPAQRDLSRNFYFVTHRRKAPNQTLNNWLDSCRAVSVT